MSGHTPGPWVLEGDYVKKGHRLICVAYAPQEMPDPNDGRMDGESWLDAMDRLRPAREAIKAETRANARLFFAAPMLLEACVAMMDWDAREVDHAVDFNARMDLCSAAFNKARAAVAAATGDSHE